MAQPSRPPGGGGEAGEGLGRSRGGFTTKPHLSAGGRCRPLSLLVTPGTAGRLHPTRAGDREDPRSAHRAGTPTQEARQPRRGQGIQQRALPGHSALLRYSAHHPGEDRQPGCPPTQGLTRRTATGLRQTALQEAQHRRADHQQAEAVPGRGHALRQTRLRLPRHHHRRSPRHLAPHMIDRTRSS